MTKLYDMIDKLLPNDGYRKFGMERHVVKWLVESAFHAGFIADNSTELEYNFDQFFDIANMPEYVHDGLAERLVEVGHGFIVVTRVLDPLSEAALSPDGQYRIPKSDAAAVLAAGIDKELMAQADLMLANARKVTIDPNRSADDATVQYPTDLKETIKVTERTFKIDVQDEIDRAKLSDNVKAFERNLSSVPVATDGQIYKSASEPPALPNILDGHEKPDKIVNGVSELKHKVKLI